MSQPAALLDTDILSELLKQHPHVIQGARHYLAEHERLAFSIITRYEFCAGSRPSRPRLKRLRLKRCAKPVSSFL